MTSLPAERIIGRDGVLTPLLARVRDGGGAMVVAPPGAGKTRLLAELQQRLTERGRRTALLTATASGATVPFGVFLPLLERDVVAQIGGADALGRAALLRVAVLDLGLQALLIDDASLLDPGSAAFVLELAQGGVAVVAAVTAGQQPPDAVRALTAGGFAPIHELRPLGAAECGTLVETTLGSAVDAAALRELAGAARGNPGLLLATVREAVADGALRQVESVWVLTRPLPAPSTVRKASLRRFSALAPEVAAWVTVVAVAEEVAADLAERLVAAEVADDADLQGWTVFDPVARVARLRQRTVHAAVVALIGARARQLALRRLLDAQEQLGRRLSDVESVARGAWLLELGAPLGAEEASRLGHLTSLSAPELSERFHRAAIAAGGGAKAEVALGEQLKRTNRIGEAQALLGAAAPEDEETADRIAAMLAIVTGYAARRSNAAIAVLATRAARGVERPDSAAVRAGLLLRERRIEEALDLAVRVGHPREATFASVFAGIMEALTRIAIADGAGALRVVEEIAGPALHTTERIPEGPVTTDWLRALAPLAVALDVRRTAPLAQRGYDRMVETGLHAARPQFGWLLGRARMWQGDPVGAARLLREAEVSPGIWHDSWVPQLTQSLAEALALSGDLAGADEAVGRLRAMHRPPEQRACLDLAVAHVAAARGDHRGAIELARGVAEAAVAEGAVVEAFDATALALRWGDRSAATALLALGDRPTGAVRELQRCHARAILDDDADELVEVAERLWIHEHRLLAIAVLGDALRHRRTLTAAGAVDRLAVWRAHVPGLTTDRPPTGVELTVREREVAELAAAGLADREVAERLGISIRTVQTHLLRGFAKLGVHRRTELASALDAAPR